MIDMLKAILFGIVEGITEWLPISSTGHMILLDEFVKLDVSEAFWDVFLVVIQLGAIFAVVLIYWDKIFPFRVKGQWGIDSRKMNMWGKILVASIPAGVIGVLFDDILNKWFYNYQTVAIMLILFGILFIIIEDKNRGQIPRVRSISAIGYRTAFIIGVFQLLAAIFPGTSRSGATIIGSLLIGVSRTVAAEFTFFLAIPAMFGGSALKLLKTDAIFSANEIWILVVGMIVAFIVSIFAIKFLMGYIKKHDFKVFGWYRIILGILVLGYFMVQNLIGM